MEIPPEDLKKCSSCGVPAVEAVTTRKSKGQPVSVLLHPVEDTENHGLPSTQYLLSKVGGKYHAGQPTTTLRAAVTAAGKRFHIEHTKAECKRLAAARKDRT